ncbi:unnamed protein product [Schistocephalus solidus]|uniref:Reverse transcriptase domain-containing protein n=1 Tax=Schistocephalus solidus TaxID=70667 RepID=A0A183TNT2_SCHSO|nr:unnamed protein product [Schistocephalus solidus]
MTAKWNRENWKKYWAEIATSMEQALNFGDTQKVYQIIRQVSGKPSTLSDSVRDVNGGFIVDNSSMFRRWCELLKCLLNFNTEPRTPRSNLKYHAEGEVADAIQSSPNNKVPGEDGIPAVIY